VSVAVIVGDPIVVEAVMVAVYLPPPSDVVGPIVSPGSVEEKATVAPPVRPPPPISVAVAVVVLSPSAGIDVGERLRLMLDVGSV
jgi:hypothetical protein